MYNFKRGRQHEVRGGSPPTAKRNNLNIVYRFKSDITWKLDLMIQKCSHFVLKEKKFSCATSNLSYHYLRLFNFH